jgi:hypothetical protein
VEQRPRPEPGEHFRGRPHVDQQRLGADELLDRPRVGGIDVRVVEKRRRAGQLDRWRAPVNPLNRLALGLQRLSKEIDPDVDRTGRLAEKRTHPGQIGSHDAVLSLERSRLASGRRR